MSIHYGKQAELYLESTRTSMRELFSKIVNSLTLFQAGFFELFKGRGSFWPTMLKSL